MGFFSDLFSNTYTNDKGYKVHKESGEFVHRFAASKKLRRKLKRKEVVHHIDGDKSNNSFNNLKVYRNQSEHMRKEHGKGSKKRKKGFWDF